MLFLPVFGQGQQARSTVTGQFVDVLTNEPIGWTSVWTHEEGGRQRMLGVVYARPDGSFFWQAPRAGAYRLVFRAEGYEADSIIVSITGDTNVGTIRLVPDFANRIVDLEGVSIIAERPLMNRLIDRYVFEVWRDSDAQHTRMAEFMERIPGLNPRTASGHIEYEGQRFERILINGEDHEFINANTQFPMRLIRADVMHVLEIIPPGSPEHNNDGPILNIITSRPLPRGIAVEATANAATNNTFGGNVDLVSNIRDRVVLRFGYNISYAKPPRLHSHSMRQNFADDTLTSSLQSESEFWNENRMHNFTLRGSTNIFNRPLNFGVTTSLGENNTHTYLQNTLFDELAQTTNTQFVRTTFNTETRPSFSGGDFRYLITQRADRMNQIFYRYTEQRTELANLQGIFNEPFQGQPLNLNSRNTRTQRTHIVQYIGNILIGTGRSRQDDPTYLGGGMRSSMPIQAGHRMQLTARYTNRYFDNMIRHYNSLVPRIEGLSYRQHTIYFRPSYQFINPLGRLSGFLGVALEYENYKGYFYGTETSFDFSQFAFNPRGNLVWRMSQNYNISISYMERKVRPSLDALNPFIDDTDPMNLFFGNPELESETHRYLSIGVTRGGLMREANFVRRANVSLGATYGATSNAIELVTQAGSDGISKTTFENISRKDNVSIGLSTQMSFVPKNISFFATVGYQISVWDSPDFGLDRNSVGSAFFFANLWADPWTGGRIDVGYSFSANPIEGMAGQMATGMNLNVNSMMSQSNRAFYTHLFRFRYNQEIIRNRLFASVSINNPFESRQRIQSEITGSNFHTESWREQMGRTFTFSLRWNFGRLRDRVPDAAIIDDGTSRGTR